MKRLAALSLCLASLPALGASSLTYTGDPLPVPLPVGEERRVEIRGAREIRVGLSGKLRELLRVESAGPHVWFTARDSFPPKRVYLETEAGLLVLSVRADAQAPTEPLDIVVAPEGPRSALAHPSARPPGYVTLMRYAVQSLYAPDLREVSVPGIRRTTVEDRPVDLFRCRARHPSACGGAVESVPHAAWEARPYHVTAIMVRNRLSEPLTLDPRDIRGRFMAATIAHPRLDASGSARDTTTVVLISSVPFEHAR